MILKFEKFIENSGLEMLWTVRLVGLSFVLQIFIFLILLSAQLILRNANFKLNDTFIDSLETVFYSVFFSVFLYSIIKYRGILNVLKSLFRFGFFLIITNTFIIYSGGLAIIPSKYKDWESFILVEDFSNEDEVRKSSYIEKILNKIFK